MKKRVTKKVFKTEITPEEIVIKQEALSTSTLTLQQKMKFCVDKAIHLNHEERVALGKMIVLKGYSSNFKESVDGTRIILDDLKDDLLINNLYMFIDEKIKAKLG